MYTVIPIFKEPFLHPLHENNGLSALWCQPESAEEPFFIIQKHPDSDDILQDYKWLDEELITQEIYCIIRYMFLKWFTCFIPPYKVFIHYIFKFIEMI